MSRRPISMGIQQPNSVGGGGDRGPPPTMYDTSVSSYTGDSGASWNTPRSGGMNSSGRLQQQQQQSPRNSQQQQQQAQQQYSYFPKSHPNNPSGVGGGGQYHQPQSSPPTNAPVTPNRGGMKQSQYTMMASQSYVPKSPRSDIGAYKVSNSNNNYRQSYVGQQQQQPMAQQQKPNQQSYQPHSPAATATTAATSTGGSQGGGYRSDYYSRSPQHGDNHSAVGSVPGRAMTEPIVTDRDRFSPQVINRFTSQQQQHPQVNPDHYQTAQQYASRPKSPGQQSVTSTSTPRSNRLGKFHEQQQNHAASFRRQVSTASSSATVASSTSSNFARSQQAQHHPEKFKHHQYHHQHYEQQQHPQQQQQQQNEQYRSSPPPSSYPDPEPSMDDMESHYLESRTMSSEGVRTTSSSATRPTRHVHPTNAPQQQENRGRLPNRADNNNNNGTIELTGGTTPTRGRSPSQRSSSVDPSARLAPQRSRSRSAVSQYTRSSHPAMASRSQSPSRNRSSNSSINNSVTVDTKQATDESSMPAVSPGANRTRYLAERFEQRMRSRGRSSQLNSAMNSAYSQQQQPPTHVHTINREQDEKKEPEEQYYDENGVAIEKPDHTTVRELRHKLWDDKESLQVRVPPNTKVENGERGRDFQPNPANSRQTRSLSPRAARRAQESAGPGQEVDAVSNSGSASSAGRRFNSKFYEAAALTAPEFSHSGSGSAGGVAADSGNQLLGAMPNPYHQHSLHSTNKSSWMNSGDRGDDFAATSQATTPKINNAGEEHISSLLQRLHSVNRGDPSRALMEIDEILKQEALKEDPTYKQALRVPDTEHYMKYRSQQDGIPSKRPEDDDESEGETTVSSITNPTYRGDKKLDETIGDEDEGGKVETKTPGNKADSVLGVQANKESTNIIEKASEQPEEELANSLTRAFKPIQSDSPHPPTSVSTKDQSRSEHSLTASAEKMGQRPGDTQAESAPKSPSRYGGMMSDGNADDLELKIRRWDELTGKAPASPYQQGTYGNKKLLSPGSGAGITSSHADESEGLGSILTPRGTNSPARKPHPWDGTDAPRPTPASTRETRIERGNGASAEGVSAFPTSDIVGKRASPANILNISNDLSSSFDDAWVALPTSRFFPSSPTHSSEKQHEKSGSPKTKEENPYQPVSESKRSPSRDRKSRQLQDSRDGSMDSRDRKSTSSEKAPKPKRRLRSLLQRGRSEKNTSQALASASVSTSIVGGGNRNGGLEQEEEAPPPRGRRYNKASDSSRSRSLEDKRVRNPNIARKFSRMLRVYGDE